MKRTVSLKRLSRTYEQLRKRYFMDAEPPLHVPPPASEVHFSWLPDNSDALAETEFDDDGDPVMVRVNPKFARYAIVRESVLHELTHIRLGLKFSCGGYSHAWSGARVARSMAWHKETLRLAQAGAIRL